MNINYCYKCDSTIVWGEPIYCWRCGSKLQENPFMCGNGHYNSSVSKFCDKDGLPVIMRPPREETNEPGGHVNEDHDCHLVGGGGESGCNHPSHGEDKIS